MSRGFGGGGSQQMQQFIKQAAQIQEKITKAQSEAEQKVLDFEGAGGSIKVSIDGKPRIKKIQLDQSLLSDKETLEDALIVAINEAITKAQDHTRQTVEAASQGFKVPGLF